MPFTIPNSYGLVFLCPVCGQEWARSASSKAEWLPLRMPCPIHPWAGLLPGSLWLWPKFVPGWNESLPRDLLQRELGLLLTFLEKETENV